MADRERHADRGGVDAALVGKLIAAQFPQWANLSIRAVENDGWDNRTFRLGDRMSVRLPSAEPYSGQVEKEQRWLPRLAPLLPLSIPVPLAMGVPGAGFPWNWSVYQWIEGESPAIGHMEEACDFATSLARFLAALARIDATDGPAPGLHNFFRGGPLTTYDTESRDAISALRGEIDSYAVTALWEAALEAPWRGSPVWFHGDVSAGNLLASGGRLRAVIDFGCSGVGDPACDVTIAWTLFSGASRDAFRTTLPVDSATWARGRGWAMWKALITLAQHIGSGAPAAAQARHVIDEVLRDHEAHAS